MGGTYKHHEQSLGCDKRRLTFTKSQLRAPLLLIWFQMDWNKMHGAGYTLLRQRSVLDGWRGSNEMFAYKFVNKPKLVV